MCINDNSRKDPPWGRPETAGAYWDREGDWIPGCVVAVLLQARCVKHSAGGYACVPESALEFPQLIMEQVF